MMDVLSLFSLKCRNFKPFGEEPAGFEKIMPFNIVIGRNNTGKTTLLDLIDFAKASTTDQSMWHKGARSEIVISLEYNQHVNHFFVNVEKLVIFRTTAPLNAFHAKITWTLAANGSYVLSPIEYISRNQYFQEPRSDIFEAILNHYKANINNIQFIRLSADRNIRPEIDKSPLERINYNDLAPEGDGATKILNRMLNNNNFNNRRLIEEKLTDDFNTIYEPDGAFDRILVLRQEVRDNRRTANDTLEERWEIHLEYRDGTTIPMSRMGSGVKTILLVLMMIHVVPSLIPNKKPADFLFGFEELENNLHPAIQKRLFLFLRRVAENEKCRFLITTHSHVVIDLFSRDELAQILHVSTDPTTGSGVVNTVSERISHNKVFEDLDVRASDLLQSNCIVWVEGPSDRVYFNRWVELVDPEIKEHLDYEFAFTSGTLISHNTFDPDAGESPDVERMIHAIKINRNVVVLMDRDRVDGDLKPWVVRVAEEVERSGGMSWITQGKEVENYIPHEALKALLKKDDLPAPEPGDNIFKVLRDHGAADYSTRKVALAEKICPLLTPAMISAISDLSEKIDTACQYIRRWNFRPKDRGSPGEKSIG